MRTLRLLGRVLIFFFHAAHDHKGVAVSDFSLAGAEIAQPPRNRSGYPDVLMDPEPKVRVAHARPASIKLRNLHMGCVHDMRTIRALCATPAYFVTRVASR